MSCSGECTITTYDMEWEYTAKPIGAACSNYTEEQIKEFANENFTDWFWDIFQDSSSKCGEGCECVEIEDQEEPKPTKWTDWKKFTTSFKPAAGSNCRIGYTAKYRYRSYLYKGNCQKTMPSHSEN